MWNHGVNSSVSRLFPKPTGADTFHTLGTFQHDNSVGGLVNWWQTPDAFIGAIYAVNGCGSISWHPSSSLVLEDCRCFNWCFPFCWNTLCTMCDQQLLKLLPLSLQATYHSHKTRFPFPASVEECVARLCQLPGRLWCHANLRNSKPRLTNLSPGAASR